MDLFHNMYEMYESIYVEIMIMPKLKKEADFVLKKVRRPKIIFWRSGGLIVIKLLLNMWHCPLDVYTKFQIDISKHVQTRNCRSVIY